ncbi:MAG: HAD family hydrolase [Candidatus Omnitrophota bacterium]
MEKIKLVIFDLDGTLVNAYPAIIESFQFTMQRLGYPKQNPRAIRGAVGWGDENLLKPFIGERDLNKAILIYRRHHKEALLRGSSVFPKAGLLLKLLKRKGYKLAVASNRPTRFSKVLIRHLKINRYFNYVLCADKLKHIKPHPEILQKIIQRLHVLPSEAIYVGDMAIDAQAGRSAKIKTIMLASGSSSLGEIKREKPFLILKNASRLFTYFKRFP